MRKSTITAGASCLALLAACFAAAAAAPSGDEWRTRVQFGARKAEVEASADGYLLKTATARLDIARQAARSDTASPLLDAFFALAQSELAEAATREIRDHGYNNDKPIACDCLRTGELWPYVWTRDVAYATDLGLYRFDPQRARNSLLFKLSGLRSAAGKPAAGDALYVMQDTGSGGSWPVSTDRVVWFLGARHLLDDKAFAAKVYNALTHTLAQDRRYVFDDRRGLYRGETSFLDWREQSYPDWTARNVQFIAESFALSTNVLHYEALQLAAELAQEHGTAAAPYRAQAAALKAAIERTFWREDRGLYMSYVGGPDAPHSIEAYDLLGTALAIVSGVAAPEHARRALAAYPTWPIGSPVIWPERRNVPIYHNRAVWPFVSAYALRAARAVDDPARIAHELRSILREAALSGSNMENFTLVTAASAADMKAAPGAQAAPERGTARRGEREASAPARPELPNPQHEPPPAMFAHAQRDRHDQPAVNSRRQLWSVGAALDAVVEGVFGLTDRDTVEPKLPRELLPMLFGDRDEIRLTLPGRRITLVRPVRLADADNLLIAGTRSGTQADLRVTLRGVHVAAPALPLDRPLYAPATPAAPRVERKDDGLHIRSSDSAAQQLYLNGAPAGSLAGQTTLPDAGARECVSVTARDADGIESLPSEPLCVGDADSVGGEWPRSWTAPGSARYEARLRYRNAHGPIMTGITAAVKRFVARCGGEPVQADTVVMPHSVAEQDSTAVEFDARAGQRCRFALEPGFNMSFLERNASYTGGEGGKAPLDDARIGVLRIAALPAPPQAPRPSGRKAK